MSHGVCIVQLARTQEKSKAHVHIAHADTIKTEIGKEIALHVQAEHIPEKKARNQSMNAFQFAVMAHFHLPVWFRVFNVHVTHSLPSHQLEVSRIVKAVPQIHSLSNQLLPRKTVVDQNAHQVRFINSSIPCRKYPFIFHDFF